VSVVYVTKNGAEFLDGSLAAVRRQRGPFELEEIIAIDSGSSDATLSILARHGARVESIPPAEFGHGRTRNLGARLARGDLVVFLTQDASPADDHWLARLIAPFADDPLLAGVWSRHAPRPGCHPMEWRRVVEFPLFHESGLVVSSARGNAEDARSPELHAWFSNNASAIPRAVLERWPFPEVEFAEDQAWARLVLAAGFRIALANDSVILHSHAYSPWTNLQRNFDHACATRETFGVRDELGVRACVRAALRETRRDIAFWATARGRSRARASSSAGASRQPRIISALSAAVGSARAQPACRSRCSGAFRSASASARGVDTRMEPSTDASPTPRTSVLIPSFNHGPFVLGAVQSALDQTENAIEVIVIDDGSTDDSLARLATIDDARVRVLSQENQGLSRTLNRGLELARAPWIKFLPSDDMLVPTCIELQLRAADEIGRGVVFCLPEVVDAGGRPLADPAPQAWFDTAVRDGAEILGGLVERNFLSAPGALFERELALAVGGFDPELRVAQDYDLWLKLLPRGPARLIPDRLVRVRWHGANQSAVATPATEAERSRALLRAIDDVGLERWIARFAEGSSGRRAGVQGRRALAGALLRSGLPDAAALAERIALEARRLERGGAGVRVATSIGRALAAMLQVARRHLRPRWRVALDGRPGAAAAYPGVSATRIDPGPCREHWLVLDPAPLAPPGDRVRGAELALALARRGLRVTYGRADRRCDRCGNSRRRRRRCDRLAPRRAAHAPSLRATTRYGSFSKRRTRKPSRWRARPRRSGARVLYDRGVPPQTLGAASLVRCREREAADPTRRTI
jgi:rhamnosyltransferase